MHFSTIATTRASLDSERDVLLCKSSSDNACDSKNKRLLAAAVTPSGMALDSKAAFKQRAVEVGLTDEQVGQFETAGTTSFAKFAYCTAYQPGQSSDGLLLEFLPATFGQAPSATKALKHLVGAFAGLAGGERRASNTLSDLCDFTCGLLARLPPREHSLIADMRPVVFFTARSWENGLALAGLVLQDPVSGTSCARAVAVPDCLLSHWLRNVGGQVISQIEAARWLGTTGICWQRDGAWC